MKLIAKYHLTTTERRNILAMMNAGLTSAKVNKMNLRIEGDKVMRMEKLESGGVNWYTICTIAA